MPKTALTIEQLKLVGRTLEETDQNDCDRNPVKQLYADYNAPHYDNIPPGTLVESYYIPSDGRRITPDFQLAALLREAEERPWGVVSSVDLPSDTGWSGRQEIRVRTQIPRRFGSFRSPRSRNG